MVIFGKNGFIRKKEVAFAKKLLVWQYEKSGSALPDEKILFAHAEKIVAQAHIIAKKNGTTVLEMMKTKVTEFINKKSG